MNKTEFIDELRNYLNEHLDKAKADEELAYYQDYLNSRIANGEEEARVIEDLGVPSIIGRTILDSLDREKEAHKNSTCEQEGDSGQRKKRTTVRNHVKLFGLLAAVMIILLLVVIAVTKIIQFLFPVILIAVILAVIMKHR